MSSSCKAFGGSRFCCDCELCDTHAALHEHGAEVLEVLRRAIDDLNDGWRSSVVRDLSALLQKIEDSAANGGAR